MIQEQAVPAIALRMSNSSNMHHFISLDTGKGMHNHNWDELLIDEYVIQKGWIFAIGEEIDTQSINRGNAMNIHSMHMRANTGAGEIGINNIYDNWLVSEVCTDFGFVKSLIMGGVYVATGVIRSVICLYIACCYYDNWYLTTHNL